ncbi:MAG TPA: Crp/Fnr family transcriptional regulator [Sedimentibacter sp.]|jgi:CRP/FNR family transcriptional regulator|nr:Crp/Fnr family transcriptional regulator [Sedimentibacter sp.]HOK48900.1 Crp/Fnr family transcriptional regulator [Sedimentibacter sp.]HOV27190.1 Crp/Fnr family transcriptional regulator [Pseudobacteroides sp.]HRC81454.1 Crp/Fnr family transcriptional regulator [Sedimentibacter sp.]
MLKKEDVKYIEDHLEFWDKLSESERQLCLNNFVVANYKKGANLHGAGKECQGLILVRRGELRFYILSEEGRDVTLFRISQGENCILSASCILSNITFDLLIDAEQDSEVLLLNVETFDKLARENIYVENYIYKKSTERFSEVMWAVEQILFMSFDKRLAVFLYDETVKTKSNVIKYTHEQIAKYVGSAREVVSRMLKNFEAQGILKLSRGTIEIIDKDKLRAIVLNVS